MPRADLSKIAKFRQAESRDIEAWGGNVLLRELDAFERLSLFDDFPQLLDGGEFTLDGADAYRFGTHLIALSIVDDEGSRCMDSSEGRTAVAALAEYAEDFAYLLDLALTVNGMGAVNSKKKRKSRNGRSTSRGK